METESSERALCRRRIGGGSGEGRGSGEEVRGHWWGGSTTASRDREVRFDAGWDPVGGGAGNCIYG
jgi:hypothetical protein